MKIENIRPKEKSSSQQEAYLRDVETYKQKQHLFSLRNCPGCLSSNNHLFSKHLNFSFVKCDSCFSIFMNPGPTEQIVQEFYRHSANYKFWSEEIYPKTRESRRESLHQDRATFILEASQKFSKTRIPRKVLEIGAGTGDTLSVLMGLTDGSVEGYAIEPNLSMKNSLLENKINVMEDISQIDAIKFDIIMAFEVLEHFLNPDDFFKFYSHLLAEDGLIILSTPNAHSLEVQILKDESSTIDIEHISLLTPAALHSLANRHGLNVEAIATPGNFDIELINSGLKDIEIKSDTRVISRNETQEMVSEFGFSSHMKIVLSKK